MSIKKIHPKGAEYLVKAILGQARRDYFDSKPGSESRKEVERFFHSSYFENMAGIEGGIALKQLQAEYDAKQKNKKGGKKS